MARAVPASRLATGFTVRASRYSGRRFEPMMRRSAWASSFRLVSVPLATLKTSSTHVALGGQNVCARDVFDIDEVHRLHAVAEDQRCFTGGNAFHPAYQHLGIDAIDVHSRAVNVEITQRDVRQSVHLVETAQQAFVKRFRSTVNRAIRVWVVPFISGKVVCQTIHGSRRSRDDFLDARVYRSFENVVRSVCEYFERKARLFGALSYANRRLVKDQVDLIDGASQRGSVADVALANRQARIRKRKLEILVTAAHEVIVDDHFLHVFFQQKIGDMRADQTRSAGDEHAGIR